MKWLKLRKLKKLLNKSNEKMIIELKNYISKNKYSFDVGFESLSSIQFLYNLRLARYQNGEIDSKIENLEETVKNLNSFQEKEILIYGIYNNDINYTIFTNTTITQIIGVIKVKI